jgi:hypothetical protein
MILGDVKFTKGQIETLQEKIDFYSCDRGEKELFNLLVDAKLFDICTEKDLPLRNYAIVKLTELGFNQEDKLRRVIHEMLQWPAVLDMKHKLKETSDGND